MNPELAPRDFDWSSDIPELTEYLWSSSQEVGLGQHQTPEENVIQAAKNMAVTWVRFNACNEPLGWRFQADQFMREGRVFLSKLEAVKTEPIPLVALVTDIANATISTESNSEAAQLVREPNFTMKIQMLVERLKAAGFELPEVEEPSVFSDHWKTWRRYGLNSI